MTESDFITVTITGPDADDLVSIVRALVDARLAACGNIIPGITSVYRWQGAVEQEPEAIALVHTRETLINTIESIVSSLHPYDLPQIAWWPLKATEHYEGWIQDNTLTAASPLGEQGKL